MMQLLSDRSFLLQQVREAAAFSLLLLAVCGWVAVL